MARIISLASHPNQYRGSTSHERPCFCSFNDLCLQHLAVRDVSLTYLLLWRTKSGLYFHVLTHALVMAAKHPQWMKAHCAITHQCCCELWAFATRCMRDHSSSPSPMVRIILIFTLNSSRDDCSCYVACGSRCPCFATT